jgi:hypothetical protein
MQDILLKLIPSAGINNRRAQRQIFEQELAEIAKE